MIFLSIIDFLIHQDLLKVSPGSPHDAPLRKDIEQVEQQLHESMPLIREVERISVKAAFGPNGNRTGVGNRFIDATKIIRHRHAAGSSTIIEIGDGGYDSHGSQIKSIPGRLTEVAYALNGFFEEMRTHGLDKQVVVLLTSEFGRTNQSNEQGELAGTDHGYGMTVFAIGGAVAGGSNNLIYGQLPDAAAFRQSYMPVTFDIRNVHHHVLTWMGIDSSSVIIDPSFKADSGLRLFV